MVEQVKCPHGDYPNPASEANCFVVDGGCVECLVSEVERLRAENAVALACLHKMSKDGCGVSTPDRKPCREALISEDWCWSCEAAHALEALTGGRN